MIAASAPGTRQHGRLLVVERGGRLRFEPRAALEAAFRPGDLLVANDAATIPASLGGFHQPTGLPVEVRLASRPSLRPGDVRRFTVVVFGAADWHTPTELRPPPPGLAPGHRLRLGPLHATVTELLGHPRLARLAFEGDVADVWAGIARHGRPIQYAHVPATLALWDVWTPVAAHPVAFEPPSAGFALRWSLLERLGEQGVGFATLTHAAGISSTGDAALDARLPLDEPYHIPLATVRAIRRARRLGGRIIAVGTTAVRAMEHAAAGTGAVRSGPGLATGRIGPDTPLRVADGILTGVHEQTSSHYELLRAFSAPHTLAAAHAAMERAGFRNHEFGDSLLLLRR